MLLLNDLREISRGTCTDVQIRTEFEGKKPSFFLFPHDGSFKQIHSSFRLFSFLVTPLFILLCHVWFVQRLLVVELLSIGSETTQVNELSWSDELYPGEFDDLSLCNLYSRETCEPVSPRLKDWNSDKTAVQCNRQPSQEILQVLGLFCQAL